MLLNKNFKKLDSVYHIFMISTNWKALKQGASEEKTRIAFFNFFFFWKKWIKKNKTKKKQHSEESVVFLILFEIEKQSLKSKSFLEHTLALNKKITDDYVE